MKTIEKALHNVKLVQAYLLGRNVEDIRVTWSNRLDETISILEEECSTKMQSSSFTETQSLGCLVDQVIDKLEKVKDDMQNAEPSYIACIDPKYVSDVRYCTTDDVYSVDEAGKWREDSRRPVFLGVVSGKCKDELIKEVALSANISTKAVQLLQIGGGVNELHI